MIGVVLGLGLTGLALMFALGVVIGRALRRADVLGERANQNQYRLAGK